MRRALTSTATAAVLAVLASLASAQGRTHVRDVRVGAHPEFERVVVELDGPADIAWERGPKAGAESFYLDADLGRRARVIRTKLPQLGDISLQAMRVGTQMSLEPRERRMRVYLLAKPVRLVIDVAPPGTEEFALPKGVTPLAPATSIGPLENAPVPGPAPEPEPAPEPSHAEVAPEPSAEPAERAVESAPEPPPPEVEATAPEPAPAPAEPEAGAPVPAPEPEAASEPEVAPEAAAAPEAEVAPAPVPESPTPSEGFPWPLALGSLVAVAALVALALVLRRRSAPPPRSFRSAALLRATQIGVESISTDELRDAADPTSALEQRLDDEVRARVALEERLTQAGEELKVLRDRLHRVERRREEVS
jgi:hypothetical protein